MSVTDKWTDRRMQRSNWVAIRYNCVWPLCRYQKWIHWSFQSINQKLFTVAYITLPLRGPLNSAIVQRRTVWTDGSSAAARMIAELMPMSCLQAENSNAARWQPEFLSMIFCQRLIQLKWFVFQWIRI